MEKDLTVVIATYNVEKYLDQCLTSLIVSPSLMEKLEVLVIIDGSPDHCSEIAHRYENQYPQTFRVIDKENGGHGSCWNLGLKEANGKYISFLDSDDWYDNENFSILLTEMEKYEYDGILLEKNIYNEQKHESVRGQFGGLSFHDGETYSADTLHYQNYDCCRFFFFTMICKTERLRKANVRFCEHTSYDDKTLNVAGAYCCRSFIYRNLSLYNYRVGLKGQSMNMAYDEKRIRQLIQTTLALFDIAESSWHIQEDETIPQNLKQFVIRSIAEIADNDLVSCCYNHNYHKAHQLYQLCSSEFKKQPFYKIIEPALRPFHQGPFYKIFIPVQREWLHNLK